MTPEEKKLISEATQRLRLVDIFLIKSNFDRPDDLPQGKPLVFGQAMKKGVSYTKSENDNPEQLLHVQVELGVRLGLPSAASSNADSQDTSPIYAQIEADFTASYEMTSSLEDDHIAVFAEYNAVHNVWPFWRQHVFDIVQRGHLPTIEIPLRAGIIMNPVRPQK